MEQLLTPTRLTPWAAARAAFGCGSFHEFTERVRARHGDAVFMDLWPVAPRTYLLQGPEANRKVLSDLDPSLEQIFQELINVLPIAARVPSEADVGLQKQVATLFQSQAIVNQRLPSFIQVAERMRDRWAASSKPSPQQISQRQQASAGAGAEAAAAAAAAAAQGEAAELEVFVELSEFVLRADLEVLYGASFTEANAPKLVPKFGEWVRNIANGQLVGFFEDLGGMLREAIAEREASPAAFSHERSVLSVYIEGGATSRHNDEELTGLLSMTLMAAVFNTQVSLAWILVHLYSQPELLQRAREEIAGCEDLADYACLMELPFLNACIDEAVRMHTMLPGNTVLRRAKDDVQLGEATVPKGSVLWLYPNAVHKDERYFAEPQQFCPYRMLSGKLDTMASSYELVTFGHGRQRCIGEKMARAMILSFLGVVLPSLDAQPPQTLPRDDFFDLIPASQLVLRNVRSRDSPREGVAGEGVAGEGVAGEGVA